MGFESTYILDLPYQTLNKMFLLFWLYVEPLMSKQHVCQLLVEPVGEAVRESHMYSYELIIQSSYNARIPELISLL